MESAFEIIAEPNRRAILSLLMGSEQSVGDIERQLGMSQPTVSKHLRVYRLTPGPLREVDDWLAPFRRFWSAHVDALERHLDRVGRSKAAKRKTRRRR